MLDMLNVSYKLIIKIPFEEIGNIFISQQDNGVLKFKIKFCKFVLPNFVSL